MIYGFNNLLSIYCYLTIYLTAIHPIPTYNTSIWALMMIEMLGRTEFLSDLDISTLADISTFSTFLSLQPGDTIMSENDKNSNSIYLLCSGDVEVLSNRSSITSGEVVLSNKDTEIFGEMRWLKKQGGRTATVRCKSDVQVIEIDGDQLMNYLEHNNAAGFLIMRRIANILANRMRNTDVLLKQLLWNSQM